MEAIGGYFSLELPFYGEYHQGAIRLNTGRNCLEYILRVRNYSKVYIPYYTCEVILEPFRKLNIAYDFYHVNIDLELDQDIRLKQGEALLYTNYFGLKQRYVEYLVEKYGRKLIVDNTQAFYADPIMGIDSFYTCRKFFGVPDGAYLYCDTELNDYLEQDCSYDRMAHLLKRIDLSAEEGYPDFRKADDALENQPIRRMSKLTQRIMQSIDYNSVAQRRRVNFEMLHNALGKKNNHEFKLDEKAVPLVYPYINPDRELRNKLIENKIFVAQYWPNVLGWSVKDSFDCQLVLQMQPLPIDQRYQEEEMKNIISIING